MEATKEKEIMKEANLLNVNGKICVLSGLDLFNEAKNIVVKAYKNIGITNALLKEIQNKDVFKMGFFNLKDREKINTFVVMSDLWCSHAKEFVESTIADFGEKAKKPRFLNNIANSNVVEFTSSKNPIKNKIKKFLEFSGIECNSNSTITESDALSIVITVNYFIGEAYKLLTVSRLITDQILNSEDEIQALIDDDLLDSINLISALNEVWMLNTNKSKFRQNHDLYKNDPINLGTGLLKNVVELKPRKESRAGQGRARQAGSETGYLKTS